MPSAVRLPGNRGGIIRKQEAGPLCFKQLLYIARADNDLKRSVSAGVIEETATSIRGENDSPSVKVASGSHVCETQG